MVEDAAQSDFNTKAKIEELTRELSVTRQLHVDKDREIEKLCQQLETTFTESDMQKRVDKEIEQNHNGKECLKKDQ